jgi:peptide/nickel transport system substrate-binding protein
MKKVALFVMIAALICQVATASAQEPVKGGHLVVCSQAEPPGLDPTANTAAAIDRVVYSNIFEGLIKLDGQGRFVPALAERWEVSGDGLTYTFHLRKGVRFHNGEAFDAKVARWNLERAMGEKTQNPHPEYFRGIARIETPDDHTLVLTLKEPDGLFLVHMAEGDAVMLPVGAAEEAKSRPIGTGPFKFVQWVRGDRVEVERFEGYWNPKLPYLDRVTFKFIPDSSAQAAALKAGDIHVIGYQANPETALELSKDKRYKVYNGTTTTEVILSTNNKAKPFDDIRVRQAMAYAIDRKRLVDLAVQGFGTPIGSHWCPSAPYYVDLTGLYPYNPDKAVQLLKEAGYPNGFDAVIKLPVTYEYARRSGEVIADMLSKVGIRLRIEVIEWAQWLDRVFKNKDYQLTVIGHAEPWDINIYAKPDYYFQYDSPRFREAYARALKASTEEDKARYFGTCQRIIAEDAVNGFLFSLSSLPIMKAEVMGWWENYPTIALDCSEVWLKR